MPDMNLVFESMNDRIEDLNVFNASCVDEKQFEFWAVLERNKTLL